MPRAQRTEYGWAGDRALIAFVEVPGAWARTRQLPRELKVTARLATLLASGLTVQVRLTTQERPTSWYRR
jgi:hypothetical protein